MCRVLCGVTFQFILVDTKWNVIDASHSIFGFVRNCHTVFHRAGPFCIPPAMNEGSYCSTPLPAFGTVSVLDFGHSDG